jgi:hypothetical protein
MVFLFRSGLKPSAVGATVCKRPGSPPAKTGQTIFSRRLNEGAVGTLCCCAMTPRPTRPAQPLSSLAFTVCNFAEKRHTWRIVTVSAAAGSLIRLADRVDTSDSFSTRDRRHLGDKNTEARRPHPRGFNGQHAGCKAGFDRPRHPQTGHAGAEDVGLVRDFQRVGQ